MCQVSQHTRLRLKKNQFLGALTSTKYPAVNDNIFQQILLLWVRFIKNKRPLLRLRLTYKALQ